MADAADASGDAHLTVLAGTRENGGHLASGSRIWARAGSLSGVDLKRGGGARFLSGTSPSRLADFGHGARYGRAVAAVL